jgi:hypothetical protein
VVPGRWGEARHPNDRELKVTSVLALSLDDASAKIRRGPPKDSKDDLALPIWAGLVPLKLVEDAAEPDAWVPPGVSLPPYLVDYRRPPVTQKATTDGNGAWLT